MENLTQVRKLKELKASNAYLRMGTDVTDLENSIRTVGLIAPLVVSNDNVILAGARRYQALLNLGFTEAPVVVINQGELERELISIDENLVRKDLSNIEIEGHLRRAKEIYQALNPNSDEELKKELEQKLNDEQKDIPVEERKNVEILPAQKFLELVSEKTGLSPKQIHQAIVRDEAASSTVKEARKSGELSLSQTNEIVKLNKKDQEKAVNHIKQLPVREIKQFIKKAKAHGVEQAITEIPKIPHAREFNELEQTLKKLNKRLKQLELEGITMEQFPKSVRDLFDQVLTYVDLTEIAMSESYLNKRKNKSVENFYN